MCSEILYGLLTHKNITIPIKKLIQGPPSIPRTMLYLGAQKGVFSKVVLGFRNFGYDFWGVGGYVWRWLCRPMRRKISAHSVGGTSEQSSLRRRWARTPIGLSGIFLQILVMKVNNPPRLDRGSILPETFSSRFAKLVISHEIELS